jgi:hypothetical protein
MRVALYLHRVMVKHRDNLPLFFFLPSELHRWINVECKNDRKL